MEGFASCVIGLTMAMSSTALVMEMLHDKGEVASPHGSSAFGGPFDAGSRHSPYVGSHSHIGQDREHTL